jgi:hypothetical protein
MMISNVVGDRSSGSAASAGAASPVRVRDAQAHSAEEAQLPFAGYDRLNAKQVKGGLSDHSQIELEGVERYERSHRGREAVLNKLRYLRGSEPFAGYDALSVEEILAALKEADLATITRVRGYERKFANRPHVLNEVARLHRERRAAQPARAAPAYQPTSARRPRSEGAKQRAGP